MKAFLGADIWAFVTWHAQLSPAADYRAQGAKVAGNPPGDHIAVRINRCWMPRHADLPLVEAQSPASNIDRTSTFKAGSLGLEGSAILKSRHREEELPFAGDFLALLAKKGTHPSKLWKGR